MKGGKKMNNEMGKILNSHTVQFERLFPGPIERVFDYLSKPEHLGKWLMPAKVEERVGGRIQFKADPMPESVAGKRENKPSECFIRGVISQFDPPNVISYSWNELNYDMTSEVRFELSTRGDGVLLVLTHSRLPAQLMAGVGAGWHTHLEDVLAAIKGEKPADFFSRFNPRLEQYKVAIAASAIIAAAASGAAAQAAPADAAYESLKTARETLLTKYDRIWKDADHIKFKIEQLDKGPARDKDKAVDDLSRELKDKGDELHKLEFEIRDLDKALR